MRKVTLVLFTILFIQSLNFLFIHKKRQVLLNQFIEEIAEQQAYHAIAANYFRRLNPEYSWNGSLDKTKAIMVPTKKWVLKELKESYK